MRLVTAPRPKTKRTSRMAAMMAISTPQTSGDRVEQAAAHRRGRGMLMVGHDQLSSLLSGIVVGLTLRLATKVRTPEHRDRHDQAAIERVLDGLGRGGRRLGWQVRHADLLEVDTPESFSTCVPPYSFSP